MNEIGLAQTFLRFHFRIWLTEKFSHFLSANGIQLSLFFSKSYFHRLWHGSTITHVSWTPRRAYNILRKRLDGTIFFINHFIWRPCGILIRVLYRLSGSLPNGFKHAAVTEYFTLISCRLIFATFKAMHMEQIFL